MDKHFKSCVLIVVIVLIHHVSAALWYDDPTDSCDSYESIGNAIGCCDGACYDGTGTGLDSSGSCKYIFDGCIDSSEPPLCPSNQVMKTGPVDQLLAFDRGIGSCWAGDLCHWGSQIWDWSCCDCPPGTVPETPGICEGHSRACVHCTEADETLQYSAVTSSYLCNSPAVQQRECHLSQQVTSIIGNLGLATTLLGGICPTSSTPGKIITALQDVIAVLNARIAPSTDTGINSAASEAVISFITTVTSLTLGLGVGIVAAETLPISAVIVELYTMTCVGATVGGVVFTVAQAGMQAVTDHVFCTPSSSKRSPAMATLEDTPFNGFADLSIRDDTYNPCSEFVSYFPGDFTIFAKLDSDCNDLSQYKPSDTFSVDLANVTTVLQSFCTSYQSSGNSTAMIDFANMLAAIQNAIPFCDYSAVTSNSSTATTSTTPSNSTYPSSSSTSLVTDSSTAFDSSSLTTVDIITQSSSSSSSTISSSSSSPSSTTTTSSLLVPSSSGLSSSPSSIFSTPTTTTTSSSTTASALYATSSTISVPSSYSTTVTSLYTSSSKMSTTSSYTTSTTLNSPASLSPSILNGTTSTPPNTSTQSSWVGWPSSSSSNLWETSSPSSHESAPFSDETTGSLSRTEPPWPASQNPSTDSSYTSTQQMPQHTSDPLITGSFSIQPSSVSSTVLPSASFIPSAPMPPLAPVPTTEPQWRSTETKSTSKLLGTSTLSAISGISPTSWTEQTSSASIQSLAPLSFSEGYTTTTSSPVAPVFTSPTANSTLMSNSSGIPVSSFTGAADRCKAQAGIFVPLTAAAMFGIAWTWPAVW